jgi:hypothetical protein
VTLRTKLSSVEQKRSLVLNQILCGPAHSIVQLSTSSAHYLFYLIGDMASEQFQCEQLSVQVPMHTVICYQFVEVPSILVCEL